CSASAHMCLTSSSTCAIGSGSILAMGRASGQTIPLSAARICYPEAMASDIGGPELSMDGTSLYREDTYTDRKIGTIRVLTPVTPEGSTDLARKILYVGETQLLTTGGLLPLV